MTSAPASSRAQQRAWYFYDWGNSAFTTTVVTLFFGPYLTSLATAAAGEGGRLPLFGFSIDPRSLFSYLVSLSVMTQVLCLPLVGAIADYGKRKREILGLLALIGASATCAMFFLSGTRYLLGAGLFLVANLSFGASIVVYNSFLPEIAAPEDRDAVSSRGFGFGYAGGGLLLCLNLYLYANAAKFGLSDSMAVRISLLSAGLWWGLFTLPAFFGLRNNQSGHALPPGENYLSVGVRQVLNLFREMRQYPQAMLFLVAFLLYNDGIQTVIALASQFGSDSLHMSMASLTQAILMVQFVAFLGALLFDRLARWIGAKRSVIISLLIWTAALFYAWHFVETEREFFILAFVIGLVLGGSQALSRSLFSLLIPKDRSAEYFSIYEISDKGTSWISPLFFGLALDLTGNYRLAIFSLVIFFLAGLAVLLRVNVQRGMEESANVAR
ncbi:MAG: MFS transporter [Bryobacter sp.]